MRRTLIAAFVLLFVVGTAAGAATPAVGVDAPTSINNGATVSGSLVVSDVTDADGVGSFTVNVSYDPAVVSVTATGTSTFDIETSKPASGVLRIVGYTSEYPGPDGTVTLATLKVTGTSRGSSALDTTVETFSDADGNALANTTTDASVSVKAASSKPKSTDRPATETATAEENSDSDTADSIETGTPTATAVETSVGTATATAEETPTERPSPTEPTTAPADGTATMSASAPATTTEAPGIPGFGPVVAVLALLASAALASRRG